MVSNVLTRIRKLQSDLPLLQGPPPPHQPEMLLIGCVDARLNPKTDIGVPDGKALIFRNIAALVAGMCDVAGITRLSEAAALEFAVDVMCVKDIVIMGHTDCGGIRACLHGADDPHTQSIRAYLAPLADVRAEVLARGGDEEAQARAMEEAAVRQSVSNVRSYDVVKHAEAEGRLAIHGWVIDTGTKRIKEMNLETGVFTPMIPVKL